MQYKDAKNQFDYWTKELNLEHTFSFDEAWAFAKYRQNRNLLDSPVSEKLSKYTKEQFQIGIKKVERLIKSNENGKTGDDVDTFNPLKHSFGDGCYVREVFNPAGELIVTKIHKTAHPFFLLKGTMSILSEDGEKRIEAPHYGITKANTKRIIYAHTDCTFVTVHVTNSTDLSEIEKEVIRDDFEDSKEVKQ
jgi:hypothetical protein